MDTERPEDFYQRLREELLNTHSWPSDYLYKFIVPTDEVKIAFKAPERAATVEPIPDGDESIDYLCLVMPLRLLD